MANFVTTLSKLTSLVDYLFWEIYVKLTHALIAYPRTIFTVQDMLNTLALPQTTNVNKITRRKFLDF